MNKRLLNIGAILLIAIGVVCNQWVLSALFSPDGNFGSFELKIRVAFFEIFLIVTGFFILRHRQADLRFRKKPFIIIFGWMGVASGILMNEWGMAILFGLYDFSARIGVLFFTILNIFIGSAILKHCDTIAEKATFPQLLKKAAQHSFLLSLICGYIIIEIFSYYYFQRIIPPGLRGSVYFVLNGTASSQPSITAYLWSNYRPNPAYSQVNQYGWRYGGGPKLGRFRIFCSGGSTTWSDRATSPEKTYPAKMEQYLREQGYDVDVVNGGASYYTSAEELGTLAFRGIYTEPDVVLIHTGGNDIYPFMSRREYQPDYSHWRTVEDGYDNLSRNDLFRAAWTVPSWTFRVWAMLRLKPDAMMRAMLSKELDSAMDILLDTNDFSQRQPVGLERNLRSMIAIARTHGATPVTILFNQHSERYHQFLLPFLKNDPQKYADVRKRADMAISIVNKTILRVSNELNVPVIPYHLFAPSHDDYWQDQCHLNNEGLVEKAIFIGQSLVEQGILKDVPMQR